MLTTHGLLGAVKVLPLTDFADRFDRGSRLILEGDEHVVEWSRRTGGNVVVKLEGIDSRAVADLLRGRYLEVNDAAPRRLSHGRFYHHEIVGLAVCTQDGRSLGRICEVMERPANDVWVARLDSTEFLIPAVRDAVVTIDLEAGRLVVADWLLEVDEA